MIATRAPIGRALGLLVACLFLLGTWWTWFQFHPVQWEDGWTYIKSSAQMLWDRTPPFPRLGRPNIPAQPVPREYSASAILIAGLPHFATDRMSGRRVQQTFFMRPADVHHTLGQQVYGGSMFLAFRWPLVFSIVFALTFPIWGMIWDGVRRSRLSGDGIQTDGRRLMNPSKFAGWRQRKDNFVLPATEIKEN